MKKYILYSVLFHYAIFKMIKWKRVNALQLLSMCTFWNLFYLTCPKSMDPDGIHTIFHCLFLSEEMSFFITIFIYNQ